VTKKVPNVGRGFAGNLTTRRDSVLTDWPSYRRTEGGFKELNVSSEPE
jgi:hypothetical protein